MNRSAIVLVATLFCASNLLSQTAGTQQATTTQTPAPVIRLNTEEVNLDMVFKDKKGNSVHDLRPEEIHVFEDGAEQHLSSVRYITGDSNTPSGTPATQ